jgi:tetratricopeptide (TPR) repeat protein
MLITNTHKLLFKRLNSLVILFICFTSLQFVAQKNFIKEADIKYENEAYFSAIDLYKKGEVRIKDVQEKARINFQIAECYRESIEPEQAQTYYDRAIMLRYQKDNPSIYLSLANVLKEQGDYEQSVESINKYLEVVPDNKEAKDFLNSCEMAVTWKSNPTKHIMQNEVSLNSSHYDYSPTWADNTYNKIIFVSARDGSTGDEVDSRTGESFMDLYITERDNNGKWFEAVPLPKGINTKDNEGSAVLTPDGKQIFHQMSTSKKQKKERKFKSGL